MYSDECCDDTWIWDCTGDGTVNGNGSFTIGLPMESGVVGMMLSGRPDWECCDSDFFITLSYTP